MQRYIKQGDITQKFAQNEEHPVLGEYDSEVAYVAEISAVRPEYITESRAQAIRDRQREVSRLHLYMLRDRYYVEIKSNGDSRYVAINMREFDDHLIAHRADLNAVYFRFDKDLLIRFLHHFHEYYVLDEDALQDIMQSLQIRIPLTTQGGYKLLHEGKFEEAFLRVAEIGNRGAYDMGKRCAKRYKKNDWAIKFYLHADKTNEFYFKWAYTRALWLINVELNSGREVYSEIFLQLTFDQAFALVTADKCFSSDTYIWNLGVCCELIYPDEDMALTCFRAIPEKSEYYPAASDKVFHHELSTLDQAPIENRERLFRRALAAADYQDNQWLVDQIFGALCDNYDWSANVTNIKGDADTLVALAAQIRTMKERINELESEIKCAKTDKNEHASPTLFARKP